MPIIILVLCATTWLQAGASEVEGNKMAVVASAFGEVSVVDHAPHMVNEHSHMVTQAAPPSRHKGQWMRRDRESLLPDPAERSEGEVPTPPQEEVLHDDAREDEEEEEEPKEELLRLEVGAGSNSSTAEENPQHPYVKFQVKDSCSRKGLAVVESEAECEQAAAALGIPKDGCTVQVRHDSPSRPAGCYLSTQGGTLHKLEFNRKLTSTWASPQFLDMWAICKRGGMVKWYRHRTKCMAVIDNSFLGIFTCNLNDANQQFALPPLGKGPIKPVHHPGKCVGPSNGATGPHTTFKLAPCDNRDAQTFELPQPGEKGHFKQKTSGRCVSVAGGGTHDKNKFILWDCDQNDVNQVLLNPDAPPALPFPISCHTTGLNLQQDELMVLCPGGCKTTNDLTWGSGPYRIDSSICRAGIHAGAITNEGGTLQYKLSGSRRHFPGKQAHGVNAKPANGPKKKGFNVGGAPEGGEEPEEEEEAESAEPPTTTERVVKVKAPVPAPVTTEEAEEEPEVAEAPAATTTAAPKPESSRKKMMAACAGVVILGGIGAGVYFGRQKMAADPKNKAAGMFEDVAEEAEGDWGGDEWQDDWGEGAGEGEGEHAEPESGY